MVCDHSRGCALRAYKSICFGGYKSLKSNHVQDKVTQLDSWSLRTYHFDWSETSLSTSSPSVQTTAREGHVYLRP
jgi:hypothetical protein